MTARGDQRSRGVGLGGEARGADHFPSRASASSGVKTSRPMCTVASRPAMRGWLVAITAQRRCRA
ncbi:hypothetical protein ACFQ51_04330 [Streptomyces kaempferi]